MLVYRIECQIHKRGPFGCRFSHSGPCEIESIYSKIEHAWELLPSGTSDGLSYEQAYGFMSMSLLRRAFRSTERRLLAKHNYILVCYETDSINVGDSKLQCTFELSTAQMLWKKKLG